MIVVDEPAYVRWMQERILAPMADAVEGLGKLFSEVTYALSEEQISEDAAAVLYQTIKDRQGRQRKAADRRTHLGGIVARQVGVQPVVASPAPKKQPSKRQPAGKTDPVKLFKRRERACVCSMPKELKSLFSTGEQAALSIVSEQNRHEGVCALAVGTIAARARVCVRTAQNAIRKAALGGLLTIEPQTNAPNLVTVVSDLWRKWWLKWVRKAPLESEKIQKEEIDKAPPMGARNFTSETPKPSRQPFPAKPTLNQQISVSTKLVEEASPRPAPPEKWPAPKVQPWMTLWHRSFLTKWASYVHVDPAAYPFAIHGAGLREDVRKWLEQEAGHGGAGWGVTRIGSRFYLGFKLPQLAAGFEFRWRGAKS